MDNHFECMWDMFRDVPSIETPGVSVLDEYYWLNKHDPNYSLCRASEKCGQDAHTDKKFTLDKDSALALSKLFMTPEKDLEDKKISEILPDSFWDTNFWLYWQTMFAFQRWSSALEMKRYLCRYVHHIDGLPDFSALRFTKYNQYESMILPLVKYLESHGVRIEYGMDVRNVIIETVGSKKVAKQIVYRKDGREQTIDLIEDDLVFITNGCCTDTSCYGDQTHAPDLSHLKNGYGESWDLWKAIASQAEHGEYGKPEVFCSDIDATNWMSATVATSDEEIIQHIIDVCKRDPRTGKVTTGGIVTVKDSTDNWYLSWTINRQPQFKAQDKNTVLVWLYSLNTGKPGNYVKKAMRDCTGEEVCREWLYHIGVPTDRIDALAEKLAEMEKRRGESRKARAKTGMPVVSLVGYTNVGKSSLMNALCGPSVAEADMLFATLDPTSRKLVLPSGMAVLLVDTVGFVSRLPHNLVEAFKSTLEEAAWSDVIVRVADAGDEQREEQLSVTDEVLDGLDCADIPRLTVYNKCDKPNTLSFDPDILLTSAKTGYGLDKLLQKLDEVLSDRVHTIRVLLPYDKLGLAAPMRERGSVQAEEYRENGLYLEGIVKTEDLHFFEGYLV